MTLEVAIRRALDVGLAVEVWPDQNGRFGADFVVARIEEEDDGSRRCGGGTVVGNWYDEPFENLPKIIAKVAGERRRALSREKRR
jgi:hypothetical protein